uniref:Uncharacterized protein n=1 Tax=Salmo trutta TaxID=8032 RepID=A0A674F5A1_SALTR
MYFSPLEMIPLRACSQSVRHDSLVNLNSLAKNLGLGSGNLCYGGKTKKVGQGCATALELFCDKVQSAMSVYFHPFTNASIMGLKLEDLTFLKDTGHEPVLQSFD